MVHGQLLNVYTAFAVCFLVLCDCHTVSASKDQTSFPNDLDVAVAIVSAGSTKTNPALGSFVFLNVSCTTSTSGSSDHTTSKTCPPWVRIDRLDGVADTSPFVRIGDEAATFLNVNCNFTVQRLNQSSSFQKSWIVELIFPWYDLERVCLREVNISSSSTGTKVTRCPIWKIVSRPRVGGACFRFIWLKNSMLCFKFHFILRRHRIFQRGCNLHGDWPSFILEAPLTITRFKLSLPVGRIALTGRSWLLIRVLPLCTTA